MLFLLGGAEFFTGIVPGLDLILSGRDPPLLGDYGILRDSVHQLEQK